MSESRIYTLSGKIVRKANDLVADIRGNHAYGFGAETTLEALEELQGDLSSAIDVFTDILREVEGDINEIENCEDEVDGTGEDEVTFEDTESPLNDHYGNETKEEDDERKFEVE